MIEPSTVKTIATSRPNRKVAPAPIAADSVAVTTPGDRSKRTSNPAKSLASGPSWSRRAACAPAATGAGALGTGGAEAAAVGVSTAGAGGSVPAVGAAAPQALQKRAGGSTRAPQAPQKTKSLMS